MTHSRLQGLFALVDNLAAVVREAGDPVSIQRSETSSEESARMLTSGSKDVGPGLTGCLALRAPVRVAPR